MVMLIFQSVHTESLNLGNELGVAVAKLES